MSVFSELIPGASAILLSVYGDPANYYPCGWRPDAATSSPISTAVIVDLELIETPGAYESSVVDEVTVVYVDKTAIPNPARGDRIEVIATGATFTVVRRTTEDYEHLIGVIVK